MPPSGQGGQLREPLSQCPSGEQSQVYIPAAGPADTEAQGAASPSLNLILFLETQEPWQALQHTICFPLQNGMIINIRLQEQMR